MLVDSLPMLKSYTFILLLILQLSTKAQISLEGLFTEPKLTADTLYFPFEDGIQLIVINYYDTWERQVAYKEAMQPRGMSWAAVMGPPPKNMYLFRNTEGKIVKTYHGISDGRGLKGMDYFNAGLIYLYGLRDFTEYHGYLKYYEINEQVGLINTKGEVVVPAVYDDIRRYQDLDGDWEKLIIEKDGYFGFLDTNLNVLFPPIYRCSSDTNYYGYPEHNILNDSFIKVYKNGKCGLIDENGVVLIDFKYDNLLPIHDSMIVGLINKELINPNQYFWNNVQACEIYDVKFNLITSLDEYDHIEYNGIKRFIVKKGNLVGVVNHKGKVIIPIEYNSLAPQDNNYYVVKGNKSGVISLEGKVLIPIEYECNMYFYEPAIYVTQNGLIGVYSNKYQLIAEPQYKQRYWEMGKFMLVRPDGSKGFVLHQKGGSYYQSPEGEVVKME